MRNVPSDPNSWEPGFVPKPSTLPPGELIADLLDSSGRVDLSRMVARFRTTKVHLAELAGVSQESFHRSARASSIKNQARLREMLEVLVRVAGWAGSLEHALVWYTAQPIAAFAGRTPESLVKTGYAEALRDYLDSLSLGGYA